MLKKLTIALFLVVCIFSNAAFATDEKKEKITDLSPWKGENVSFMKLYENKSGERFYKDILKHLPKSYTKEVVEKFIHDLYYLKFATLKVVDENTITIDNKITGDYVHVGSFTTKWEKHELTWQIFKTDSKEMIQAGFTYFIFLPYHQHDKDSLQHAHFRYGNENFDFLATDPSLQSWWPTIYQPATTDEAKATKQMTTPKMARMMADMIKKKNTK